MQTKTREPNEEIEDNKTFLMAFPVYLLATVVIGLIYLILRHFWGHLMVMSVGDLTNKRFVLSDLQDVWLMFVWAVVATVLITLVAGRIASSHSRTENAVRGIWISICAGIFEEIIFRIFIFLSSMVLLTFTNFITFGLVKWFYVAILIPVANFFTLGALSEQLLSGDWLLGAAIVSTSLSFRNAHKRLGFVGMTNAWFIGMVLFWLVFHYGIFAAIAAHILYDALVFAANAVLSVRQRPSELLQM